VVHLLICAGLLVAPAEEPKNDDALARQVSQLVRELDAPALTDRDRAESRLAALGPAALPHLPALGERTSAETAQRLTRIRQQLLRAQALAATQPSLVTLQGDDLALDKVFAEISKQTGNPITDHRAAFGQAQHDVRVKADFAKTPYWKALDDVLDQGQLTLYGFAGQRGAFVVNRPPGAGPRSARASYAGMFRVEPVRFEAQRDLRNESLGSLRFFLELSWEPRLQPFAVISRLADVAATGDGGAAIAPSNRAAEPETLVRAGTSTTELEIPFELPPPGTEKFASLKGKLTVLVPGPLVEFRFDDLPLAAKGAPARPIEKRQGGTVVTLGEVRKNGDVWAVELRVRFEAPETALESHRAWILDNEAYFQDSEGNSIKPGGLENTLRTKDEVGMNYLFDLPEGPDKLSFVYRTPLVVVELPVEYEFRDLRLP
jgi:hypothetical protein